MKRNLLLTVMSLLSVLLFSIHLTQDILRGIEPGGLQNLTGFVVISVVWLCGTLLLSERRSGQIIMLVGSILAAGVPVLHMRGAGVGGASAKASGAFLFIWTLLAMGVSGAFSVILSVRALRGRRGDNDRGRE